MEERRNYSAHELQRPPTMREKVGDRRGTAGEQRCGWTIVRRHEEERARAHGSVWARMRERESYHGPDGEKSKGDGPHGNYHCGMNSDLNSKRGTAACHTRHYRGASVAQPHPLEQWKLATN